MTLRELIEQLEEIEEEHGGTDGEVLIAHQPRWAFEYELDRVGVTPDGTVYLAQGRQMGYLSHDGAVSIDWDAEELV